jgi:hypothetical protein
MLWAMRGGWWALWCAIMGTLGCTGYYGDVLGERLPAWLAVSVFTLPIALVIMVNYGELDERVVMWVHGIAAGLFFLLAMGMEVGSLLGHRPEGHVFYRVLAHLAWTFGFGKVWVEACQVAKRRREGGR